jgi:putative ABC transport system substrate-binding protein
MTRRAFITLLGGAVAGWPLAARAQPVQRMRRIAVLMALAEDDPSSRAFTDVLREGLQKLGWTEGRNFRVDLLFAPASAEQLQRQVQDLVASQPDLVITQNTPATRILMQQTRTIPIVFANVSDPVGDGFVASLARPGGNLTGFIDTEADMGGKWVELLKEMAPHVTSAALVFNPDTAPRRGEYYVGPFQAAAASLGLKGIAAPVRDTAEIETLIAAQARTSGALVGTPDSFLRNRRVELVEMTARYRVPAIYPGRYYSEVGGLMSYGHDTIDNFRRSAIYADRILRGEKPGELPVQVPVKFELVINLKTAKALGLDVPWILQQRADEVIE